MEWKEQYDIYRAIHESNKSAVFTGWDKKESREVIIRVLYHSDGNGYRLLQQAETCEGIPQIYSIIQDGDDTIVVEEKIQGRTLEERMKENPVFSREEILYIFKWLLTALSTLHQKGIIHRDIKPSNVMLSDCRAVLIDFDAARQYRENDNSRDTVCLGTQGYAPPEQYGFSQTDQRSDIYSLGVLIKEISSHTPEFGLAPVLSKCTAFSPDERYPSVQALRNDLQKRGFLTEPVVVPVKRPSRQDGIRYLQKGVKILKICAGIFYLLMTAILLTPMDFEVTVSDYLFSKLVYLQIPLFPAVLTFNWFHIWQRFPLLRKKSPIYKITGLLLYGLVFVVVIVALNAMAFQFYSPKALGILQSR